MTSQKQTLKLGWEAFKTQVAEEDPTVAEWERLAFYGGAIHMMRLLVGIAAGAHDVCSEDELRNEVTTFLGDCARKAKPE